MAERPTCSISVTVWRTTTEIAWVKVPVDGAVMRPNPGPDGHYHLDPTKVTLAAVRLGLDPSTRWVIDG